MVNVLSWQVLWRCFGNFDLRYKLPCKWEICSYASLLLAKMHKIHTACEASSRRGCWTRWAKVQSTSPANALGSWKRVSERHCDGWEGKHSMQRNYLYNYYPILTYQCISGPENESIGWNESCMDSEGVQTAELVKKGVEGGSKKNQGRRAAVGSSSGARNMEAGDKTWQNLSHVEWRWQWLGSRAFH